MEENREAAVGERRGRLIGPDRRIVMLVVSAALQWVLILLCIVYLAVLSKHPEVKPTGTDKLYVITELVSSSTSPDCRNIELEPIKGDLTVEDGSIVCRSTGIYALYLYAEAKDRKETGKITLNIKHPGKGRLRETKEDVRNGYVRATLLEHLYQESRIYLNTSLCLNVLQLTVFQL